MIVLKVFSNFPCAFFFGDYLESFCLISKYLGFPRYLIFVDFKLYFAYLKRMPTFLLCLLRLILWPHICLFLVNVPCAPM